MKKIFKVIGITGILMLISELMIFKKKNKCPECEREMKTMSLDKNSFYCSDCEEIFKKVEK